LFDFAASAPGPLLATTDEVVGALSDLDAVRTGWGDAISAFNATYNELQDGKATDRVLDAFFHEAAG
jgi:CDP-glycerol glycerophosphotransferase